MLCRDVRVHQRHCLATVFSIKPAVKCYTLSLLISRDTKRQRKKKKKKNGQEMASTQLLLFLLLACCAYSATAAAPASVEEESAALVRHYRKANYTTEMILQDLMKTLETNTTKALEKQR